MFIVIVAILGVLFYALKFSGETMTTKEVRKRNDEWLAKCTLIDNALVNSSLEHEVRYRIAAMTDKEVAEVNREYHEILCEKYKDRIDNLAKLIQGFEYAPIGKMSPEERIDSFRADRKNAMYVLMAKEGFYPWGDVRDFKTDHSCNTFQTVYHREFYRLCLEELRRKHPELNLVFIQTSNEDFKDCRPFAPFILML